MPRDGASSSATCCATPPSVTGLAFVRGRWSHLMADSGDELREFAGRLRLNPEWIQKPATVFEHYDITAAARERALRMGAARIPYGEGG